MENEILEIIKSDSQNIIAGIYILAILLIILILGLIGILIGSSVKSDDNTQAPLTLVAIIVSFLLTICSLQLIKNLNTLLVMSNNPTGYIMKEYYDDPEKIQLVIDRIDYLYGNNN